MIFASQASTQAYILWTWASICSMLLQIAGGRCLHWQTSLPWDGSDSSHFLLKTIQWEKLRDRLFVSHNHSRQLSAIYNAAFSKFSTLICLISLPSLKKGLFQRITQLLWIFKIMLLSHGFIYDQSDKHLFFLASNFMQVESDQRCWTISGKNARRCLIWHVVWGTSDVAIVDRKYGDENPFTQSQHLSFRSLVIPRWIHRLPYSCLVQL